MTLNEYIGRLQHFQDLGLGEVPVYITDAWAPSLVDPLEHFPIPIFTSYIEESLYFKRFLDPTDKDNALTANGILIL